MCQHLAGKRTRSLLIGHDLLTAACGERGGKKTGCNNTAVRHNKYSSLFVFEIYSPDFFFISNLTLLSNVVTPVSIEVIIIFPSRRPTRHTIEKHTNASIFMKQQKCKSAKKQFIIRVIKNI